MDYACVVDRDDCGLYKCVAASDCPDGTTYTVFNPNRVSRHDARMNGTNNDDGYFCDPDGLQCYFDSSNNFIINAVVDNRNPWIDGPADDDEKRKITLISKTKHDQHVDGDARGVAGDDNGDAVVGDEDECADEGEDDGEDEGDVRQG